MRGEIVRFREAAASIERARSGSWGERAALQHKIIEANQWLAERQYWNRVLLDLWIPDEVDDLEMIK